MHPVLRSSLTLVAFVLATGASAETRVVSYGETFTHKYTHSIIEDDFAFTGSAGDEIEIVMRAGCLAKDATLGLIWNDAPGSFLGEWVTRNPYDRIVDDHIVQSGDTVRLPIKLPGDGRYNVSLYARGCKEGEELEVSLEKAHQLSWHSRFAVGIVGFGALRTTTGYTANLSAGGGAQVSRWLSIEAIVSASVIASGDFSVLGLFGGGVRFGSEGLFGQLSVGVPAAYHPAFWRFGGLGGRFDFQFELEDDGLNYFLFGELHSHSLTEPNAGVIGAGMAF